MNKFKANFFLIVLFGSFFSPCDVFCQTPDWNHLSSTNFVVYYLSRNNSIAESLLQTLEVFYPRLVQEIGCPNVSPIEVFLCNSEDSYQQLIGKSLPEWSAGVAIPGKKTIILKDFDNTLSQTAIHELTHVLLKAAVDNKPVPTWFNEGLAIYFSEEKEFASSSLISKALTTNSILPLNEIERVLFFDKYKAQLAYQESYLAVLFLIEKFGVPGMQNTIHAFARNDDPDQALREGIGVSLEEFEQQWLSHIEHKYRWYFLIDIDSFFWILMVLLFILGFIIMKFRNRRKIKQWETEENELVIK
jgi:hypothetical protein